MFTKVHLLILIAAISMVVVSTALAAPPDLKTDKGTLIPHRVLDVVEDGTDKIQVSDGKAFVRTDEIPDSNPNELNSQDMGPGNRTEDFTDDEKAAINQARQARFQGIEVVHDPTKKYNCHGFTFKNSEFWVGQQSGDIVSILADQGWEVVEEEDITADDVEEGNVIVIYRDAGGGITHSGKVTAVEDGQVTEVQSKWGDAGEYRHAPGNTWPGYGTPEYRRGGSTLQGGDPFNPPPPLGSSTTLSTQGIFNVVDDCILTSVGGVVELLAGSSDSSTPTTDGSSSSVPYVGTASVAVVTAIVMASSGWYVYKRSISRRKVPGRLEE